MKAILRIQFIVMFIILIMYTNACSNDSEDEYVVDDFVENTIISQEDSEGLLFMLEEEKLARDTYKYLYEKWNFNQFSNIKNSEQTHINAIENLLKKYKLSYSILPEGVFNNPELQALYDTFKVDGSKSVVEAIQIGATIEDLDIKDLEKYIIETENAQIRSVYQSLQCGSRNHLRSFTGSLVFYNATYTPQFLSLEEFNSIVTSPREQCR